MSNPINSTIPPKYGVDTKRSQAQIRKTKEWICALFMFHALPGEQIRILGYQEWYKNLLKSFKGRFSESKKFGPPWPICRERKNVSQTKMLVDKMFVKQIFGQKTTCPTCPPWPPWPACPPSPIGDKHPECGGKNKSWLSHSLMDIHAAHYITSICPLWVTEHPKGRHH